MTDTMTSQGIDLSSWDTLYNAWRRLAPKVLRFPLSAHVDRILTLVQLENFSCQMISKQ